MSEHPTSKTPDSGPAYLSGPWFVAFVFGLCVVAALAGALAKEFDFWPGLAVWSVGWCVILASSWYVTRKYANPMLPTVCGVMVGMTFPRPSEEWVREFAGAMLGNGLNFALAMLCVAVGLAAFGQFAKRHNPPPSA